MAPKTQKRSRSTAVNPNNIEQATSFLQELPSKPKTDLSLREAVSQMQDSIRAALAKGYSYQDLSELLGEQGIPISAFTLKNYVPSGKRSMGKAKIRRVRKSQASGATVQAASGLESAEQSIPAGEPSKPSAPAVSSPNKVASEDTTDVAKSQRKTRSRVKASDQPGTTQKPRSAAKVKATSKTQTSAKPSAPRGRKKA